MSRLVLLSCMLAVATVVAADSRAVEWGYDGEDAPASWSEIGYEGCGGKYQSPINIDKTTIVRGINPRWVDYQRIPSSLTLTNLGHTMALTGNGTKPYLLIGDSLVYELNAVHFHWGKKNTEGSEHNIRGRSYPIEMHAVHKLSKNGVIVDPPEIIVVSVLFQVSHLQRNLGVDRFIHALSKIREAESSTEVIPFAWSLLIQEFHYDFFAYRGSLTTPPCSEVVTWFVSNRIAKISQSQLEAFRTLDNEEGNKISGNFRPLQPLNGRQVYYVAP